MFLVGFRTHSTPMPACLFKKNIPKSSPPNALLCASHLTKHVQKKHMQTRGIGPAKPTDQEWSLQNPRHCRSKYTVNNCKLLSPSSNTWPQPGYLAQIGFHVTARDARRHLFQCPYRALLREAMCKAAVVSLATCATEISWSPHKSTKTSPPTMETLPGSKA